MQEDMETGQVGHGGRSGGKETGNRETSQGTNRDQIQTYRFPISLPDWNRGHAGYRNTVRRQET